MISDAIAAFHQVLTPAFRAVFWKVLGLTLVLLAVTGVVAFCLLEGYALPSNALAAWLVSILSGFGMLIGSVFLIPPVSLMVAGLFLDDLAELSERDIYPQNQTGTALPTGQAMGLAVRFTLLSVLVNITALILLLVPGINISVFLFANAYLFGREYFELAALRFMSLSQAKALRQTHSLQIYAAGFLIALFVAVPILNLVTPLFGAAFMVRRVKRLRKAETGQIAQA